MLLTVVLHVVVKLSETMTTDVVRRRPVFSAEEMLTKYFVTGVFE